MLIGWFYEDCTVDLPKQDVTIPITFTAIYTIQGHCFGEPKNTADTCNCAGANMRAVTISSNSASTITVLRFGKDITLKFLIIGT